MTKVLARYENASMKKCSNFNLSVLSVLAALHLSVLSPQQAAADVMDYRGTVGKEKIGLVIDGKFTDPITAGPLKGSYFYTKYNKDISLDGDVDKFGNVTLYERDSKGQISAMIKGKVDPEIISITGTWSKLDGSECLPFSASSVGSVGGTIENRYIVAGVEMPTAQFEKKVEAFVKAVAAGNKDAVAGMVAYPLRVNHSSKKRTMIRNKKELLSRYNQVFTPRLVKIISTSEVHNLFARDMGVMLGSGQVWLDGKAKPYVINQ